MTEHTFECESCQRDAEVEVYEQWDAEVGAVEFSGYYCAECAAEQSAEHLDEVYANYVFRIEPLPDAFGMETVGGGSR